MLWNWIKGLCFFFLYLEMVMELVFWPFLGWVKHPGWSWTYDHILHSILREGEVPFELEFIVCGCGFIQKILASMLWNIFLISNKDSLIIKYETPKHTGSIQGWTSQERKLQKSSKSKIEKGWFLHTENQSSFVLPR